MRKVLYSPLYREINIAKVLSGLRLSQNDLELLNNILNSMYLLFKDSYSNKNKPKIQNKLIQVVELCKYKKEVDLDKNHTVKSNMMKLSLAIFLLDLYIDSFPATYNIHSDVLITNIIKLKRLSYKQIRNDRDYDKYNRSYAEVLNSIPILHSITVSWLSLLSVDSLLEVKELIQYATLSSKQYSELVKPFRNKQLVDDFRLITLKDSMDEMTNDRAKDFYSR